MFASKDEASLLLPRPDISQVLEVLKITKRLPLGREHIEVLKGISFEVKRGEMLALVGPSGS